MKIEKIKINGIENPVGFLLDHITLSYVITDVKQINDPIILEIFKGEELIYNKELDYSHNYATDIDLDLEKETRYVVSITCGEENGKGYFETGTNFDCPFISPEKDISHPVVFKRFVAEKQVKSARLYVTGLGLYEAFINGQKVGNEFLTPNCNNYNAYLQYQTYDISDSVKKENVIEIALGDGWYKKNLSRNNVAEQKVILGVRPEHIELAENGIDAKVDVSEMMGSTVHLHVTALGQDVVLVISTMNMTGAEVAALSMGSSVKFCFPGHVCHVFSKDTEINLEA